MAQYTLELRELVESGIKLFDYVYPIYDPLYKPILEKKIIDHFYFREIGCETAGRFIFNLRVKLNEIMPLYNKMYVSTALTQRILNNYVIDETMTKTNTTNGTTDTTDTNHSTGTTDGDRLFSDTPQGRLTLDDPTHVTDIHKDTTSDTGDSNGTGQIIATGSGGEDWARHMEGNIGVQTDADAIKNYNQALINIDMLIIDELNVLFMGVY